MDRKRTVVIGLLGTSLDRGRGPERWENWRPSVSICQHEDLLVDRFELLYEPKFLPICEQVCQDIAVISPETKVCARPQHLEDPWDFEGVYGTLHDFASSYSFNPEQEEYLVHITTGSHVAQICLFLLTEARYIPGRLIQTIPPHKPPNPAGSFVIVDLDLSKYDRLASRLNEESRLSSSMLKGGIETRNAKFNRLIDQIEQVSMGSKAPILLVGPTGAGKSQLARRIYELKKHRRQVSGDFVEVNCATLRGDGAMSALFGHVKGAFTGAMSQRSGLLRSAEGGLLFLDEIGELGLDEQAMLLRAVEEKRFLPVGSDKEIASDFQLIGGTNRDLQQAVACGKFREDLLARINMWTFCMPALRDRSEDIEPNLDYELAKFARLNGIKVTFNKEARQRFLKFAISPDATWAGNFRDLNAAVVRMATLSAGGRITVEVVEDEIQRLRNSWTEPKLDTAIALEEILDDSQISQIDPFDRAQLAEVLRICQASRSLSEAGRRLFAVSRSRKGSTNDADRLRKYLARFGLDWKRLGSDVQTRPGSADG